MKNVLLTVLILSFVSLSFAGENQASRLSVDAMKNLKGGAGTYKCGPAVALCGAGTPYPCQTTPVVGGYKCKTFEGYARYFVTACDDGKLTHCAHNHPTAKANCYNHFTCEDHYDGTTQTWSCNVKSEDILEIPDCYAY